MARREFVGKRTEKGAGSTDVLKKAVRDLISDGTYAVTLKG